jgi:hypothetical protein
MPQLRRRGYDPKRRSGSYLSDCAGHFAPAATENLYKLFEKQCLRHQQAVTTDHEKSQAYTRIGGGGGSGGRDVLMLAQSDYLNNPNYNSFGESYGGVFQSTNQVNDWRQRVLTPPAFTTPSTGTASRYEFLSLLQPRRGPHGCAARIAFQTTVLAG